MSTDDHNDSNKYELLTAVLLGLAAIGSALSGFEANQWGSKQLEAYGEANKLTTKAAALYNESVVEISSDFSAVARAKEHILAARDAAGAERARHLEVASYIYTTMMSEKGYKAMELPMAFYVEDNATPAAPVSPAPAANTTPGGDENEEDAAPAMAGKSSGNDDIPDDVLLESLDNELDEDYVDAMSIEGEQMFQQADSRFEEGGKSDNIGDMYDLAGIAYAIALFFGGIGILFKTKMRWTILYIAGGIFILTSVFMAFQPWTM